MFTRAIACPLLASLCGMIALGAVARMADAQESPYCRRVRARAASDAALLMSPRVIVQGVRFPQTGVVDVGATVGSGFQARAALSFSPLDFYKGLGVMEQGDADCAEHEVSAEVDGRLEEGNDPARLAGLLAQVQYLRAHHDEWRAVDSRAAARLGERTITLVEFETVRQRIAELERKLTAAEGEAGEIEARRIGAPSAPIGVLARQYAELAGRLERSEAHVRRLEPWQFQVTAGVIPQEPVDWYGLAEVSFSLGALARGPQEERHADARTDEVRRAPYEVEARVQRFRAGVAASLAGARRQLAVVEGDLAVLTSVRETLERSDGGQAAPSHDALVVEELSTESEEVFLRAFIDSLVTLLEGAHV
jgi:hypothetical protein